MKKFIPAHLTTILVFSMTTQVYAGGMAGGGGPPALEDLLEMMAEGPNTATVFEWDRNKLGLGIDAPLDTELFITRSNLQSDAIHMCVEDFDRMAGRPQFIQAINLDGDIQSYRVEKTLEPDTLRLVAPQ